MSPHYLAKLKVAHRAHDTIEFLHHETPDFTGPELWPADSPDLNPVDYRIWGLMQERVYQSPIQDVHDLKQWLISVWAEFKQSVIDKAIDQWRPRLRACIRARGQHFEQLTDRNNCLSVEQVCFYKDIFVQTSNLKANIHIVPFQFVKNTSFAR